MSDAQTILKMIEEVSPDDKAKLDEIDARVCAYLHDRGYSGHGPWRGKKWVWVFGWIQDFPYRPVEEYTRSRDALKAIRPEGLILELTIYPRPEPYGAVCTTVWEGRQGYYKKTNAPTEELAELHAIIQAIEWERSHA